ncbi:MAG: aspartate kinase [Gammaproteobacteria bacterium]
MRALATTFPQSGFSLTEQRAFVHESTVRQALLLIAGHSGQIGSALCRQLQAHDSKLRVQGLYLVIAGLLNSREFLWRDPDGRNGETFPRQTDDWPNILRCFLAGGNVARLFVDCTAGSAFVDHYPELLEHGIGIVTPNKLANAGSLENYLALQQLARRHGTPYRYETTVGAALPVLGPLADLVRNGDKVKRIEALLSGTLSFIFNRVNNGERFSTAVREARARGFTEPHPGADLVGADSGRKLLILMREAGFHWEPERVQVESLLPQELVAETDAERFLAGLADHDVAWAKRAEAAHRRSLRLVYLARFDGRSASVGVTHVASTDPFALLAPGENLIRIWTERYQPVPLSIAGPGAGPELTAAGVLTDILKAVKALYVGQQSLADSRMAG